MTRVTTFSGMQTEAAVAAMRRLRRLHWSQARLRREMAARGERVPAGLISRWFAGTREPNMTRAAMLQDMLGVAPRLWALPAKSHGKAA